MLNLPPLPPQCKDCKYFCAPPPEDWYGLCYHPDSPYGREKNSDEDCSLFEKLKKATTTC